MEEIKNIGYQVIEFVKDVSDEYSDEIECVSKTFKISKTLYDFKDLPSKLFASKLKRFLMGVSQIPYKEREKYINKFGKIFEDNMERLLNIINKVDSNKKIQYLNNLFKALVFEEIDMSTFFRMSNVVENSLSEDLNYLKNLDHSDYEKKVDVVSIQEFLPLAKSLYLIEKNGPKNEPTWNMIKDMEITYQYKYTDFGNKFYQYALGGDEIGD